MFIKCKKLPPDGTERVITKYCWLPTWVADGWVWFETVTIKQRGRIMYYEGSEWYQWDFVERTY